MAANRFSSATRWAVGRRVAFPGDIMTELKRIRPWLAILSGASVLLLAWFHASLWFGQGSGGEESYRLALMAVLSDVAKVFLFSAGVWLVLSSIGPSRIIGLLMVLVAVALVALSVTAVFGSLQVSGAKSAPADPAAIARADNLVEVYTKRVQALTLAHDDLPATWITKRSEAEAAVSVAVEGLVKATDERAALDHQVGVEGAYFVGVGQVLGTDSRSAQQLIYSSYSVLLELVSLLSALVSIFGDRLLARSGVAPTSARTAPALAVSGVVHTPKSIQRNELPERARMRQVMARFLGAAYQSIEAGQGDAFLGRNKIMTLSGLDRTAVDWCQRQLLLKQLITTGQNPQRTIPKHSREVTMNKCFPTAEAVQ